MCSTNLKCSDCGINLNVSIQIAADNELTSKSGIIFYCAKCQKHWKYINFPNLIVKSFVEKHDYLCNLIIPYMLDPSPILKRLEATKKSHFQPPSTDSGIFLGTSNKSLLHDCIKREVRTQ